MNKISSIYIHFPYCFHLCNYCDFYKRKINETPNSIDDYEILLEEQWRAHEKLLASNDFSMAPIKTLYLGGGTPSLWSKKGARFFSEKILGSWLKLEKDYEFTLEVDPNTFNEDELKDWKAAGVNRISIGSQAFEDETLKILDRKHSKRDIIRTVEKCQKYFDNISMDFILGIPFPEKRDLAKELNELLLLKPNHMSVYMLSTRINYPHKEYLPDDEQVVREYQLMATALEAAGLSQYEVSNFARKGHKSVHNLEYWKYNSVAAIGPSATGLLVKNGTALRYKWKVLTAETQNEELTENQFLIEYVYMHLRSEVGLDMNALFQNKLPKLERLINRWNDHGYLKNGRGCTKVQLTLKGYLMLDSLMGDLFTENLL